MVSNFEDAVELDYMSRDVIPSPLLLEEGIEVCGFLHPSPARPTPKAVADTHSGRGRGLRNSPPRRGRGLWNSPIQRGRGLRHASPDHPKSPPFQWWELVPSTGVGGKWSCLNEERWLTLSTSRFTSMWSPSAPWIFYQTSIPLDTIYCMSPLHDSPGHPATPTNIPLTCPLHMTWWMPLFPHTLWWTWQPV